MLINIHKHIRVTKPTRRCTGNTAISHFEELLVATRVSEEGRVDDDGAFPASCACAVQQEVDVNVAVARERNLAQCRDQCVISTVTCRLEDDHVRVGRTDDLEYRVEARVFLHQLLTCSKQIIII